MVPRTLERYVRVCRAIVRLTGASLVQNRACRAALGAAHSGWLRPLEETLVPVSDGTLAPYVYRPNVVDRSAFTGSATDPETNTERLTVLSAEDEYEETTFDRHVHGHGGRGMRARRRMEEPCLCDRLNFGAV